MRKLLIRYPERFWIVIGIHKDLMKLTGVPEILPV